MLSPYNKIAHEFTDIASGLVDTFSKAADDLARRSRIGPQLRDDVNELVDGDLRGYGQIKRAASQHTHPWARGVRADQWREDPAAEQREHLNTHEFGQNTRRGVGISSMTDPGQPKAPGLGSGGRFEIPPEEAQKLFEQVRGREPDFAGAGNRVNLVDTSSGLAVVRFKKEEQAVTFLKKWMPENMAAEHARECGVRTPEILYAGVNLSTGTEFTIMRYISGETRDVGDLKLLHWFPDLLDQDQLMSSHPLPIEMQMDIPEWQQQMIQHADDAYYNLSPDRLSKLDELGIGPLSDYVQPDISRSGEPVVFSHNDLYPLNLRLDDQGKLWIFDWETAGPGDPLYNTGFLLERMGKLDEATRIQATAMWTERILAANPVVDVEAALLKYRTMED
ncbi:aminoglycoside phosphotransferase family protein [Nocardia sp. NRRL WC-3656]|uniref:aminoglycoside phosphotransferase family protein n=1 Tax=Nocardia sp. NRRL WC-3656 TaxID=1463824 RepID=UPI0009E0A238|nr:aminoglycoside phosphotransferase family protein [Nocardia sp. NRRL WC-3656]